MEMPATMESKKAINPETYLQPEITDRSREAADQLLEKITNLAELEKIYQEAAKAFKEGAAEFIDVEAAKFALNKAKVAAIAEPSYARMTIAYFKEAQRQEDGSVTGRLFPQSESNPHGENSAQEIIKDALWLTQGSKLMLEIQWMNDTVAEKQEDPQLQSEDVVKERILELAKQQSAKIVLTDGLTQTASEYQGDVASIQAFQIENVYVSFDSIENQIALRQSHEPMIRARFEDRDPATGKLRERKGGAVLAGLEAPIAVKFASIPVERRVKLYMDSDRAYKVAGFVGDASFAILEQKAAGYLADLNSQYSVNTAGGTRGKRKIFFSGLVVATLFPQLANQYNYYGTTQVPAKALAWEVDTKELTQVRPNVDLAVISAMDHAAQKTGTTIAHGPVINIDNAASSTMSMADVDSEWSKTYEPIFKDAASIAQKNGMDHWLINFLPTMSVEDYKKLFYVQQYPELVEHNANFFQSIDSGDDATSRTALANLLGREI